MPPRITRVTLANYRSIAVCDVHLGPLTVLVGRNGSGKSNFVDSLRFVGDSLTTTLERAVRDRGGIRELRHRSGDRPGQVTIRIELVLPDGETAVYAFAFTVRSRQSSLSVSHELCQVRTPDGLVGFERIGDEVRWFGGIEATPATAADRLAFVSVAGITGLRPVYDALTSIGTYNLNPDVIRAPQPPDTGEMLARDGRNLASVIERMDAASRSRVEQYLSVIVPDLVSIGRRPIGSMETIEFHEHVEGMPDPRVFPALNMSDGTLRAAGILVALFQSSSSERPPSLVAIEEPEIALHPAAAEALYDALSEASLRHGVLATSHSPELLDNPQISPAELLAVEMIAGSSVIGPISDADATALTSDLYTAGELLRMGQISPSEGERTDPLQRLFEEL